MILYSTYTNLQGEPSKGDIFFLEPEIFSSLQPQPELTSLVFIAPELLKQSWVLTFADFDQVSYSLSAF